MVGPLRFDGLSSGINYSDIISKLLAVERRPITELQNRISKTTNKKAALLTLSAKLLAFKGAADVLSRPSFFNTTKAVSNDEKVLAASGTAISTVGSFSFTVKRLAQTHQLISSGFSSSTSSITSTSGTLTMEVGGGSLQKSTPVPLLHGGTGIDRGMVKITDSAGKTAVIDLQGALTVQDILDSINNTTQINVRASVAGDRIVMEDLAGGAVTNFKIEDYGLDATASELGITGTGASVGGRTYIFGRDINYLTTSSSLNLLNDGLGVRRNSDGLTDVRITDTDSTSFEVNLKTTHITLQDAIGEINSAASGAGSSLRAALNADGTGLQLVDAAGAAAITVSGINGSLAAVDLGFGIVSGSSFVQVAAENTTTGALDAATGNRLSGNRILASLNSTLRNYLNGGMDTSAPATDVQGIRNGSIRITDRQGDDITLNTSQRIQTTLTAGVVSGSTNISVTSVDGFAVGNEIRIVGDGNVQYRTVTRISGTSLTFDRAIDTGVGFSSGRAVYAMNHSLSDIMTMINDRATVSGVSITATLNGEGNGLLIRDTSAGTGNMSVSGVGGSLAASDLGIQATVAASSINGTDLDPQYIGLNTVLATLNGGKGVYAGKFRITDTTGKLIDVDLSQSTDTTIDRVITDLNGAASAVGSGVRVRINDSGDGLLIEDTTPGAGTMRIQELSGGSTAKDLNIVGSAPSATPARIDGSFEYQISIASGSALTDVARLINDKGIPVLATVIYDGSPVNPYKLSLASKYAGSVGRLTVDGTLSSLSFTTTTPPHDAILLYGVDGGATDPLLMVSSSNTIQNVVPGMTLELRGTSDTPVTVTVSRDTATLSGQVRRFVDTYNAAMDEIRKSTFFDAKTLETGPLFSDFSVRSIQRSLHNVVVLPVNEILSGNLNSLASVGIKIVTDGKMSLDDSKLVDALSNKFEQVRDLFTYQRRLDIGVLLKDVNNGLGVQQATGSDFRVSLRDATTFFDVDIDGANSLGDILNRINLASGNNGKVTAAISPDGFSIQLTDATTPADRTMESPASTTTFTESSFAGLYADDFFNGATVTILSGPNQGQVRTVSDFAGSTGLITLDPNSPLQSALASGTSYRIERSLEVTALSSSSAAAQLGIQQKADLGENLLRGTLLNLNRDPGVAFRISETMDVVTRPGSDGLISSRVDGLDDSIEDYNRTIKKLEGRINRLGERLVRQFTTLELFLTESQSTMSRLQNQLSGMMAGFKSRIGSKK